MVLSDDMTPAGNCPTYQCKEIHPFSSKFQDKNGKGVVRIDLELQGSLFISAVALCC